MDSYSIGLSGLGAAQKSIDILGNNVANAASENYHRQRVSLSPSYMRQIGASIQGGGVNFNNVSRQIDIFLEQEILRQQSSVEQVSRELLTLQTVETTFGEFSAGSSLSSTIDDFFAAVDELSTYPQDTIYQNQLVTKAETLTARFRSLATSFSDRRTQVFYEAENTVEQINGLLASIGELNGEIQNIEVTGGQANNLLDKRDSYISDLSELIKVDTVSVEDEVVNIYAGGIPVVTGTEVTELEVGLNDEGMLGVSVSDGYNYATALGGGSLQGLLNLYNEHLSEIIDGLDNLATSLIQQFNQYHVQGIGTYGSFAELTGWANSSGDLSDFSTVSAGYTYIRVTNTSTGAVERTAVPVMQDASSDTLTEIASYITTNVDNVSASVNSSTNQLSISAETGYEFDFLPAVLPEPEAADIDFNGSSDPAVNVSGIYSGSSNDTLTFTVSGTGDVGIDDLTLTVTDSDSNTIDTVNIGSGYAVGEVIDIGDTGIKISLGTGDLADGDSFSMDVFADTDTSGLLSAVGLNTFFSGTSARDINVCSDISDSPSRIAVSLGSEMTDNVNAARLTDLQSETITSLDSMTFKDYYHQIVTDLGQKISVAQMQEENSQILVQNLKTQRSERTGVDINEEAANMIIFEQMFQGMSKYLVTVRDSIRSLMQLV